MPRVIRSLPAPNPSSEAGFRDAVSAYEGLLADCGLVRTADTGQINPATAPLPAASEMVGYSMWAFADALQSAAPIFLRVRYGKANTSVRLAIELQAGVATDGSGSLVGVQTAALLTAPAANTLGAGVYPSFATHSSGSCSVVFAPGSVTAPAGINNPSGSFTLQRTCDNVGNPTAEGFVLIAQTSASATATTSGKAELVQTLPAARTLGADSTSLALVPWLVSDSKVGVTPQMFQHFVMLPKCRPLVGSCAHLRGEVPRGEVFQVALVGAVPRTYIGVGDSLGLTATAGAATRVDSAVLWED